MNAEPTLVVFARTPVPGSVKTRFMPPCTAAQAARLGILMTRHTLRSVVRYWPGRVRLAVWPETGHPLFVDAQRELGIPVDRQTAGDLGDKMFHALDTLTRCGAPAAVLGTDVPHCPVAVLKRCYRLLEAGHDVLGPTRDGGYYLIGVQRAQWSWFARVPWGTDQVATVTHNAAARSGRRFILLEPLTDLDTWTDLQTVADGFPPARRWMDELRPGPPLTAARPGS